VDEIAFARSVWISPESTVKYPTLIEDAIIRDVENVEGNKFRLERYPNVPRPVIVDVIIGCISATVAKGLELNRRVEFDVCKT
jgi:hypothetical protein